VHLVQEGSAAMDIWLDPADDDTLVMVVPEDRAAIDEARHLVRRTAEGWGFTELDDLEVVASELVTNAIVHAEASPVVRLRRLDDDHVVIEVADTHVGRPVLRVPYEQHTRGLGLHIVDALAEGWGVRGGDDGHPKVVWARLGPGTGDAG
jgi:anti-sigma regulatory factor (Ser/Thr protein kinase)